MSARVYELHGLRVRSELPLDGRISADAAEPDFDVRLTEPDEDATCDQNARILAQVDEIEYTFMATSKDEQVIRFGDQFEFQISWEHRMINVRLSAGGDRELASILLAGNVFSALLTLRGACVLHASGIQINGSTIAVVGASGMGKSTLTALFCAAGARLISDDVLRLESSSERTTCHAGTSLIRLRPAAAELASLFPSAAATQTSDGRIAVRAELAAGSRFRLDAILIPEPSRTIRVPTAERLGERDALMELVRYPRVVGWEVGEPTRQFFRVAYDVARTVPVFRATIPWGPPFDAAIPRLLLEAVEVAEIVRAAG